MRPLVGGQADRLSVELELCIGDAKGHAADRAAEVRILGFVLAKVVKPEHDVGRPAFAVGDQQLRHRGPIGQQPHGHAMPVVECKAIDLPAVGRSPENIAFNARRVHIR